MNNVESIKKSFFWQFLSVVPKSLIGPICFGLIAKILTVEEYGVYSVLMSLNGYILLFATFGIPHVFRRYLPRKYYKKEYKDIHIIFKTGFFLNLFILICIISIIFLLRDHIGDFTNMGSFGNYYTIFFSYSIFASVTYLFQILYWCMYAHKIVTLSLLVFNLFRVVILFAIYSYGLSLNFVLYAEVASYGLFLILLSIHYLAFYLKNNIRKIPRSKIQFSRMIKYGKFSFLNDMGAKILNTATDILIITIFLGPIQAGLYGFCTRLIARIIPIMPQNLFNNVIEPIVFSQHGRDSKHSINFTFNFLSKLGVFFMMPASLGICLLSDKIIYYVFGAKYMDTQVILCIFALFMFVNSVLERSALVLRIIEKPKFIFYSKIFAVYNLVLDILVVEKYGINGVALVTVSAVLFKNLFYYLCAKKMASISMNWRSIFKIMINNIPLCLFLLFTHGYIDNLIKLVICIISSMAIYTLSYYMNKVFSLEERRLINKNFGYPLF